MDNDSTVPQENTNSQDVTVELTPLFADDGALRVAYTEALNEGVSPDAIVKGWCRIAKLALKTGDHTKFAGKINNVSKRVPINAKVYGTVAFRVMENAGMITVSDAAPIVRELTDKDFEDWWITYPQRLSNGRLVRIGKASAKNWFGKKILTRADFALLQAATFAYKAATNPKYIKDAERFLRHDLWRDFVPAGEAVVPTPATIAAEAAPPVEEVDKADLDKMMGVVNDENAG